MSGYHIIGITGCTRREWQAYDLADEVDARYVGIDDGSLECTGNHRRTWFMLHDSATVNPNDIIPWCVVLEDDAVPVDGFAYNLTCALACAPSPVVSLYLGRGRPHKSQQPVRDLIRAGVNTPWLQTDDMLHAVGIAIRTQYVLPMLSHTSKLCLLPWDQAVGQWARSQSIPVSYTWPSLVDHAEMPSVTQHLDDQHRDTWVDIETGIPVLQRRVAWSTGQRVQWTSETTTFMMSK